MSDSYVHPSLLSFLKHLLDLLSKQSFSYILLKVHSAGRIDETRISVKIVCKPFSIQERTE